MDQPTTRSEDTPAGACSGDKFVSLTIALQAIARRVGYEIDRDDLSAALGLSWMTTAVPGENDLGCWPMYARDAFIVEAGRLFGLGIRDIHPPEAARGLSDAAEFEQHFQASYRPLILRALENEQPVLAWRGWPGEREMLWGIIEKACPDGSGFAGRVGGMLSRDEVAGKHVKDPGSRCLPPPAVGEGEPPVTLERPPVQLYVVETVTAMHPDPEELLSLALDHAGRVLNNALEDRFGVVTGPSAYDAWIARLREDVASTSRGMGPLQGHRELAACVMAAHRSAARFLQRQLPLATRHIRPLIETLTRSCHNVVTALGEFSDATTFEMLISTSVGQTKIADAVARARRATTDMLNALQARTRTENRG